MKSKPTLLDLFCKAGGAGMGYSLAGFDILGVDIEQQPNYPFEFIQADALSFLRGVVSKGAQDFAVIHASPPCQAYSTLKALHNRKYPELILPTRALLEKIDVPFVIENVMGAPLIDPVRLCGSSFGLRVRRHRLFESSLTLKGSHCAHQWQNDDPIFEVYEHGKRFKTGVARVYGHGGSKANAYWNDAIGIDWMTPLELAQAIPPAYTEFIGQQLLEALRG